MLEYSSDHLWPLYEKLPKDLQEAIFSTKIANLIYNICIRNEIKERVSEVAKLTGYVLLGLLSPDEFEKTLKEELKLEDEIAERVNLEITRFIFFPLRETLEMIYKIKIKPVLEPITTTPLEKPQKDIYRESIE